MIFKFQFFHVEFLGGGFGEVVFCCILSICFNVQGSIQDHGECDGRCFGHGDHGSYLQKRFCQRRRAGVNTNTKSTNSGRFIHLKRIPCKLKHDY